MHNAFVVRTECKRGNNNNKHIVRTRDIEATHIKQAKQKQQQQRSSGSGNDTLTQRRRRWRRQQQHQHQHWLSVSTFNKTFSHSTEIHHLSSNSFPRAFVSIECVYAWCSPKSLISCEPRYISTVQKIIYSERNSYCSFCSNPDFR